MPRAAAYVVAGWVLLASVAGGCRCQGGGASGGAGGPGAPSASGLAASASAQPSAQASAAVPALAAPWSAARRGDEVIAVGARREGSGIAVALFRAAQGAGEPAGTPVSFELPGSSGLDRPASLDVAASGGGVVVRIEDRQGQGRWWRAASGEGLRGAEAEEASASVCAVGERMLGLVRDGSALSVRRWAFDKGAGEPVLDLAGGGGASLQCGARRAYLIDDENRSMRAVEGAKVLGPFPIEGGKDDEQSLTYGVEADSLVAARVGLKGEVSLRRWASDAAAPGPWIAMSDHVEAGASVELVLAHGPLVALVLTRSIDADDCKGTEEFHTVAELVVFDSEQHKQARPKARLDTWRCGAEAGPFGGGAAAKGFVVSWPRGADAACSRQGVRYGGLGVLEVPFGSGAARPGRAEGAASDLVDVGCEGGGCGAVLLARGDSEGCWSAVDARGYRPRWVGYGRGAD